MARMKVGRADIAYSEAGYGQPVVLVHGSASASTQGRSLTRDLKGQFRVYAPDLHGHGQSDFWPGPGPLTLADDAAIVAALAEHACEPVHVVGHSYGAAVALHFALAHPERLRSLVLIEPVAFHLLREAEPDHAARLAEIEELATAVIRAVQQRGVGMSEFVDFWSGRGAWSRLSVVGRIATEVRAGVVAAHFAAIRSEATPLAAYRCDPRPHLDCLRFRVAGGDAANR